MPRRTRVVVAAVTAATAALAVNAPLSAVGGGTSDGVSRLGSLQGDPADRERPGDLDARSTTSTASDTRALTAETARLVDSTARKLRRATGARDLQLRVDPATGTPAHLAVDGGFLTGPSSRAPEAIVRSYLRRNVEALGLTVDDLSTFRLRKDQTDSAGVTHLAFEQVSRGIPVFGNGLEAHLTSDGELISLQGAPVPGLDALTRGLSTSPELTASAARAGAAEDVGGSADDVASPRSTPTDATRSAMWSNGDRAALVWFATADAATLAWSTYTQAGDSLSYSHVVGTDGTVLYRRDLVSFADPTGKARVYDNYPGAPRGGTPRVVDLVARGWIGKAATWLRGANVSAWADLDDDDVVDQRERTPLPGRAGHPQFALQAFDDDDVNTLCQSFVCTWDPETAYSWRRNKKADVTNAFYLANRFHDWLARPAIGFDAADGNFQRNGGDPVLLNAMDGADTADGLPDADHINNASMTTPPDGLPPVMAMYLLHEPGLPNSSDPFLPTSTSFEAATLYHEYTHGLSNRLVTDPGGNSTLTSIQAGAMGEGWSDYYAQDYLVHRGFVRDTTRDGELRDGRYVFAGQGGWRTQSVDCDPDSRAADCTDIDGVRGGYTYADFPTIGGAPAVHPSSEVWTQTLWDVRELLGSVRATRLITQAMRLSPDDPSMLDMRNAILQANQVLHDGADDRRLWRVFADRGMGWYAGAVDGADAFPAESFKLRPAAEKRPGSIEGTLTDDQTGEPLAGIRVAIGGHGDRYAATTDADGRFRITGVLPGTYLKLTVAGVGYDGFTQEVTVRSGRTTDLTGELRRDWAAAPGGAEVVDFTGPDFSDSGCGPTGAIDQSQATGWGSVTGDEAAPTGTAVPKHVDIALPEPIDITADEAAGATAFRVDPSNTCGDPASSATDDYRIEVSTDGESWTEVADGSFGGAPPGYVDVPAATAVDGVTHVRFWMDSPQVPDFDTNCPDGNYAGCTYMDMTEIQVYGSAADD
jgi:extracellular elastinolytic metalloproteinase